MLRRCCVIAVVLLLVCATAGTALASVPRPATERVLSALVLEAGAVTPLYNSGATGAAIPIADGDIDAAFTPNGDRAYVVGGGQVTPIDINADENAIAQPPIALPHSAHADAVAIAITPNGKTALVVDNFAPYWVSWIKTATNAVTAKVKAGVSPVGIAITPNGRYAYITNANSDTVTVLSIAHHRVARTIHATWLRSGGHRDHPERKVRLRGGQRFWHRHPDQDLHQRRAHADQGRQVPGGHRGSRLGAPLLHVTNNGSGTVSKIKVSTCAGWSRPSGPAASPTTW